MGLGQQRSCPAHGNLCSPYVLRRQQSKVHYTGLLQRCPSQSLHAGSQDRQTINYSAKLDRLVMLTTHAKTNENEMGTNTLQEIKLAS